MKERKKKDMIKTVEVEYVGIEDVQELMNDVLALISDGHYASIELQVICGRPCVSVYILLGGFDINREYDHSFSFYMGDNPEDVKTMNECKSTFNNLLTVEE